MESHVNYANRNYKFIIPKTVQERVNQYLEMSCKIMGWFNENYERIEDKNKFIKLQEMYGKFQSSEYYFNLTKADKRMYNYRYFIQQIEENIFFAKYYASVKKINNVIYKSILTNHIEIKHDDNVFND